MIREMFMRSKEKDCGKIETNHHKGMKANHKALLLCHVFFCFYLMTSQPCEGDDQLFDLSHVFNNQTIYWVTERSLQMNITYKGYKRVSQGDYWYQKEEITAATHGGTHLDAPCHFAEKGWCVSDIPLDHLVAPAAVVDISDHVKDDPNIHLTLDHILQWEKDHGQIPDDSVLLVNTGWARFYPDLEKYIGSATKEPSLLNFPSVEPEVAKWLVANRKIVSIGVDTMSIDVPKTNQNFGTHVTLMKENIYGLENLNNLNKLPPTGAIVYVMPMNLEGASGAPCRIFARVDVTTNAGSKPMGSNLMCLMVMLVSMYILKL